MQHVVIRRPPLRKPLARRRFLFGLAALLLLFVAVAAADLLSRRSREEAERAYFDAEAHQKTSLSPAPAPSGATIRGLDIGGDVIGSFPHSVDRG